MLHDYSELDRLAVKVRARTIDRCTHTHGRTSSEDCRHWRRVVVSNTTGININICIYGIDRGTIEPVKRHAPWRHVTSCVKWDEISVTWMFVRLLSDYYWTDLVGNKASHFSLLQFVQGRGSNNSSKKVNHLLCEWLVYGSRNRYTVIIIIVIITVYAIDV